MKKKNNHALHTHIHSSSIFSYRFENKLIIVILYYICVAGLRILFFFICFVFFPSVSGYSLFFFIQLFSRDPFGALVNASCALAAYHNKAIRVARMIDPPDPPNQTGIAAMSTAQQFYNRAYWQLANASVRGYTEADALAALHLVGFFVLQGGSVGVGSDWPAHLDSAREWLFQSGILSLFDDNGNNSNDNNNNNNESRTGKMKSDDAIDVDIGPAVSKGDDGNNNEGRSKREMSDAEQIALKMIIVSSL